MTLIVKGILIKEYELLDKVLTGLAHALRVDKEVLVLEFSTAYKRFHKNQ